MRAALDHASRDPLAGEEVGSAAPRLPALLTRCEEVGCPLPDVAGHVEEPVPVRWERPDRRRAFEAVELQVLPRKLALPRVRQRLAVREVLVAPGEDGTLEPAPGRVFPI